MASPAGRTDPALADKFPPNFLEGVDFIETEEDAKAVEAATLKIQSTFRGKKIRAKIPATATNKEDSDKKQTNRVEPTNELQQKQQQQQEVDKTKRQTSSEQQQREEASQELCKKVSEMQVNNDNVNSSGMEMKTSGGQQANAAGGNLPEEEVERAATKIQAGFKGYKTRKELEGKLGTAAAGQPLQETAATK